MAYRQIYELCQTLNIPISRSKIVAEVCRHTGLPKPLWTRRTMDPAKARGFFILPGPHWAESSYPVVRQSGGKPVICTARALNYCWERFVYVKELMHYFDSGLQRVSTKDEFRSLLEEFTAPSLERSEQLESEILCFWRALGLLCPENLRQDYCRQLLAGEITTLGVAQDLRIPEQYVPTLCDGKFKSIISRLLDIP